MKITKDKYQRRRGGKSTILIISCSSCDSILFEYQKDGKGNLRRCYLNRISKESAYGLLDSDESVNHTTDMPKLECKICKQLIGIPMKYQDGRLAYRMKYGCFKKTAKNG